MNWAASAAGAGVARETFRGLLQPKRLVPFLVVSASLVLAQARYSRSPLAIPAASITCLAFVLVAPLAFRLLFADGEGAPDHVAPRLVAYVALAVAVNVALEVWVPRVLGIGRPFLSQGVSVVVSVTLFIVGGWGLGRDIGFEASLRHERARAAAFAKEAEAAQLLALRAHFDPHFLFNTLNAIAEWCREDGETAERAILALSSMLREVLGGVQAPAWPLSRELGLVDALLSLHAIRDPDAFRVEREVDEGLLARPIVPLLLLPLAENAVKHGPAAGHRGVIRVTARETEGVIRITLENPGRYGGPRAGSDGLPLVTRRLVAAYGAAASFSIAGADAADGDERTVVVVSVPVAGPAIGVSV